MKGFAYARQTLLHTKHDKAGNLLNEMASAKHKAARSVMRSFVPLIITDSSIGIIRTTYTQDTSIGRRSHAQPGWNHGVSLLTGRPSLYSV